MLKRMLDEILYLNTMPLGQDISRNERIAGKDNLSSEIMAAGREHSNTQKMICALSRVFVCCFVSRICRNGGGL